MKKRLLKEIRRRMEAATDSNEHMRLKVLEKAVESDLSFEPVGEIVDECGNVFSYAFGLFGIGAEVVGDPATYVSVSPLAEGGIETFARYAKRANQAFKVDKHQKEACFKFLCANYGIGG